MKLGLIGEVLGHSLSPEIHKRILERFHVSGTYELIEIPKKNFDKKVPEFLESMDGFNVTIPYKVEILPFLDEVDEAAAHIGAINTVVVSDGKVKGYNTDYEGFKRTLLLFSINPKGKDTVVLGTGGASRAVIRCLCDMGASSIRVVSRHVETLDPSYMEFLHKAGAKAISHEELNENPKGYLIVNATPAGMFPKTDNTPVSRKVTEGFKAAVDLIYNPKETLFLKEARENGCITASGLYMLVIQAMASEEYWLGHPVPEDMAHSIVEELEKLL